MNIYIYSLYKSFYFKFNKFSTLTSFSIIFSTFLCLLCIILTLNISDGFKNNIINKIIELDGVSHIYPYNHDLDSYSYLDNFFNNESIKNNDFIFFPYMQKYSIFRYNSISEGVNLISLFHKEKFEKYIIHEFIDTSGIYIGKKLANKLNIKEKTNIVGIFVDENKNRKLHKLLVKGIYETQIPSYDEYVAYADYSLKEGLEIFNINNIKDYIIFSESHSNFNDSNIEKLFYIDNWKNRNYDFFNWLNSYDIPIKILLIFLITVLLINNLSMFNLDLVNRINEINFLHSLGLRPNSIFSIYIIKTLSLTFIGVIFAIFFSYTLIFLQIHYNIISITPGIYFSKYLPVVNTVQNYIYPAIGVLLFTLFYPFIFRRKFKFNK